MDRHVCLDRHRAIETVLSSANSHDEFVKPTLLLLIMKPSNIYFNSFIERAYVFLFYHIEGNVFQ